MSPLLVGGSDICLPPISPTLLLKIIVSGGGGGGRENLGIESGPLALNGLTFYSNSVSSTDSGILETSSCVYIQTRIGVSHVKVQISWISKLLQARNLCWQPIKITCSSRCDRTLLTSECSCSLQQGDE